MPIERPATWATMSSPSSSAWSSRPSTVRHTSGSWSGWLRFTLTVRPDCLASASIHGHSCTGTRAWSGANWKTPCPARASA